MLWGPQNLTHWIVCICPRMPAVTGIVHLVVVNLNNHLKLVIMPTGE